MEDNEIEVGGIYKIKEGHKHVCGAANQNIPKDGNILIRITQKGTPLKYDVLDKNLEGYTHCRCYITEHLEPYSQQTNQPNKVSKIMQTLTNALKRNLSVTSQALYKAGLINGGLELTEQGKKELEDITYATHEEELVERAKEIIKEEEEKKSK